MRADSSGILPDEIIQTQRWVHEVFKEASRGLPWPYQAGLMVVEQLITLGMFGGLLASAWFLQELREESPSRAAMPDLGPFVAALEQAAMGPLPPGVQLVLRQFVANTDGPKLEYADLERLAAALIAPIGEHFRANGSWDSAWTPRP